VSRPVCFFYRRRRTTVNTLEHTAPASRPTLRALRSTTYGAFRAQSRGSGISSGWHKAPGRSIISRARGSVPDPVSSRPAATRCRSTLRIAAGRQIPFILSRGRSRSASRPRVRVSVRRYQVGPGS